MDVLTAHEDGASELQNSALLDHAAELDRVLFTQNDDLLVMGNAAPAVKAIVSWCDLRAPALCLDGGCIHDLELVARAGKLEDMAEEVLFLPL